MATYPNSILVKADVVNEVDVVDQNDHNILKGEIIALQTYIGTSPQGSKATMTERMSLLIDTNGAIFTTSGGFPASTFEGRFVWRPDLITAYVYGNGSWNSLGQSLSNNIFSYSQFSLNATSPLIVGTEGTSFQTYLIGWFRKISGISSAIIYARATAESGGSEAAYIKVSFGSESGTSVATGAGSGAIGTCSFTINLSALNPGSVYPYVIELSTSFSTAKPKLYGIQAIGI